MNQNSSRTNTRAAPVCQRFCPTWPSVSTSSTWTAIFTRIRLIGARSAVRAVRLPVSSHYAPFFPVQTGLVERVSQFLLFNMNRFEGEISLLDHMVLKTSPFDSHGQSVGSRFENSLEPSDGCFTFLLGDLVDSSLLTSYSVRSAHGVLSLFKFICHIVFVAASALEIRPFWYSRLSTRNSHNAKAEFTASFA